MARSADSYRQNAEYLSSIIMYDKVSQEKQVEYLKDFLHPFSSDDRCRIINHKLERYHGRTAVHLVVLHGLHVPLEYLLKQGGDPNKDSSAADLKQTPLHIAAHYAHAKCIQVLLQYQGNLSLPNQRKLTPMEMIRGKPQCEEVVTAHIAKYREPDRSQHDLEIVEELHTLAANPSHEAMEAFKGLFLSLKPHWQDLGVRFTDFNKVTLLCRVCNCQNTQLLKFLLQRAPLDPLPNLLDQKTPLHIACEHNSVEMATMLMKVWPELILEREARDDRTPLHTACQKCHRDVVAALLQGIPQLLEGEAFTEGSKLDLNIPDVDGNTPLHYACYSKACSEIVPELLAFRPSFANYVPFDVNTANHDKGRTILHVAVSRKKSNCLVPLLLQLPGSSIDRAAKAKPSAETVRYLTKRMSKLARMQGVVQSSTAAILSESVPVGGGVLRCDSSFEFYSSHGHTLSSVEEEEDRADGRLHQYSPIRQSMSVEKRKKRTRSELPGNDKDHAQPVLYITPDGDLVLDSQGADIPQNCRLFSELQLTPLVEVCALANETVLRSLLMAGVRDREERYSAKILQSLNEDSLLQQLLSFHCKQVPLAGEGEAKMAAAKAGAAMGLKLQWENAGLKAVRREWLVGSSFHPVPEFLPITLLTAPSVSVDAISEVDLSRNRLTSLPVQLFQLPNLRTSNLSGNLLQSLPVSVAMDRPPYSMQDAGWHCLELRELDLSSNSLRELPQFVWKLPKLEKILVSQNELAVLGRIEDREHLSPSLKQVNLASNKLKYVSDFLFQFPSINTLNLSQNQLLSLPGEMWSSVSLEELDVSHNQLRSLPSLDNSTQETLSSDSVSFMGEQIYNPMGQVSLRPTKLSVRGAAGRFIRPLQKEREHEGESLVQVQDPSRLRVLNLSHNSLEGFPYALPCLAFNLQELYLQHNTGITEVDIAFVPQQLKKLQAGHNKIHSFGLVLPSGERRDLRNQCHKPWDHTHVACIHRRHQQLEQLEHLELCDNCLEKLPLLRKKPTRIEESLSSSVVVQPESMDAAKPMVEDTWDPEDVASPNTAVDDLLYPKLRHLDLSHNNLTGHFNPNVGFLRSLQYISLSSNPHLTHLPAELAYLRRGGGTMKLTGLYFSDLPALQEPPAKYQNVSLNQLMSYFRSQLKESVNNRTIKLMVVGREERGKTTLLRRLRQEATDSKLDRTEGIDIHDWTYPVGWKKKISGVEPATFLTWDFAGQEQYYATHQCFYSKRSLYLVVFRLADGKKGVNEVDEWMRNIQICAAGSPVILVGTHLDKVTQSEADDLLELAWKKYRKPSIYPNLVATAAVSNVQKGLLSRNGIDGLRSTIYEVACHLFVGKQDTLSYQREKNEKDPEALFQQRIPKEYLTLQECIRKKLGELSREEKAPVLSEKEFRESFSPVIQDTEELDEAVQYLHNQGTILHFPDASLQSTYFLDPQWLTKMMANFIGPPKTAKGKEPLIQDGVADVEQLLKVRASHIPRKFQEQCTTLLGLFGVILRINEKKILIPSQMPKGPPDILATPTPPLLEAEQDAGLQYRSICRYWFTNFLPEGFWPRLICRLVDDQVLRAHLEKIAPKPEVLAAAGDVSSISPWEPWRRGLVWVANTRPILEVKEVPNVRDALVLADDSVKEVLPGDYRLELHCHLHHCETLRGLHLDDEDESKPLLSEATRILVIVMQHLETLVREWFPRVFIGPTLVQDKSSTPSFAPCWKCLHPASIPPTTTKIFGVTSVVAAGLKAVYCFPMGDCVRAISQHKKTVDCPFHGQLLVDYVMPDLVFMDLYDESTSNLILRLDASKALGIGAFGVVLKGTWGYPHVTQETRMKVAVKFFIKAGETRDIAVLLNRMEKGECNFYDTYNQIRTEVAVLSKLRHPNLTHLEGVTMQPHPALLLPLAPHGSLHQVLKEYSSAEASVLPLTMQACATQMAAGLNYLHQNHIVHLDVKSGNVLVWRFPSANLALADRAQRASDVDLRLTDYGISRLSGYHGVRLDGPVGTPGYTAPELNHCKGLEISADKGDVFSFGMTLSELLTFHPPFCGGRGGYKSPNELSEKIRNGERPILSPKMSMSSPILLQRLMVKCWHALPQHRPSMAQTLEEVSKGEFPRLRYELCIKGITAISTSCVFRVEPQHHALNTPSSLRPQSIVQPDHPLDPAPSGDAVRRAPSRIQSKPLLGAKIDLVHEVDVQSQSVSSGEYGNVMSVSVEKSGNFGSFSSQDGDSPFNKPHTQVWVCGRDYYQPSKKKTSDRKGCYSILTFCDGQLGSSVFTGYSANKSEVTALCYACYHVWMGTSTGELRIVDIVTHEDRFVCTLEPSLARRRGGTLSSVLEETTPKEPCRAANVRVLAIVAVPEVSSVLVSTLSSFHLQIWCFEDRLESGELVIQQVLDDPEFPPVYQLCKVILPDGTVEVWGTSDHSKLAVLQHCSHGGEHSWHKQFYESQFPNGATLPCKCITHAHFVDAGGVLHDHVWVSTDRRCRLVCWDAQEKQQLCVIEVKKDLELVSGIATVAVRSLLASGSELFVGATNGVVGVYSAETGAFLHRFIYHTGDVRALLEIPLPATPCVCAEVQVADIMTMGSMSSIMDTPLKEPSLSSLKDAGGGMSLHRLHPQELLKPLILSIGNGHLEMSFDHCMAGPNEQLVSSLGGSPKLVARGGQAPIYLQCWCR